MKLSDIKKLHHKKYREQFGYYLVEGEHLILEFLKAASTRDSVKTATLYVTEEYEEWVSNFQTDFTQITISPKQMAQISDTKSPQGIVACVPLPDVKSEKTISNPDNLSHSDRYIYLHEIQDPGNLGTILRTLAWFGNFRLLLSANSVDPFNPKVVRSSMGAIFHVPIELDVALSDLQKRFKKFAYLDMQGSKINTADFANYDCYLFGNEARGVPRNELSTLNANAYTITGRGNIDSLNLASAVNIVVYQLST